ncbi:hypothetical protein GGX14DRAFT_693304 [Mycena pura]|uniref:Mug135-like C-terminal domain-containing protein n=1 Tax=Mycena pura TaxID=153505 RepID=A0AAD6YRW6_9AGAR|nr:hypothetical protein GGX14DRAFT_693304 [Mycena pura]
MAALPALLADLTNAHDYNQRLAAARTATRYGPGGLPAPTALDIAEGLVYEKAIMELVGGPGAMPAWFQTWNANDFQPLKDTVDAIRIDLATFRVQVATFRAQVPFEVVPFVSGDDPTDAPHNLPAIQNTTDITLLAPADLTTYLTGYGLSAQGNPVVRARRLARHIGYFGQF